MALIACRGSLCEVAKLWEREGCADCARGDKHPSFIFSYRKDSTQRCLYVPRELVPQLRRAIDGGRWVGSRMSLIDRFMAYAAAFEDAYATDDWSKIEPCGWTRLTPLAGRT